MFEVQYAFTCIQHIYLYTLEVFCVSALYTFYFGHGSFQTVDLKSVRTMAFLSLVFKCFISCCLAIMLDAYRNRSLVNYLTPFLTPYTHPSSFISSSTLFYSELSIYFQQMLIKAFQINLCSLFTIQKFFPLPVLVCLGCQNKIS